MYFRGSYVALVTPFTKDGNIDEDKIRELVNYHINNGTAGISPCGTTGESPTLSYEEHERVIRIVVEEAKGRVQVVAGAGSNSTREAIEISRHAEAVGADAVMSIVPYYNKPSQRGIAAHFKAVASEIKIPVLMYNVPGRTGVNMLPETVYELSKIENIKGIKEASGNVEQVCDILNMCGDNLDILSGDDSLLLPMLSVGAKGVVSVTANFMARDVADMIVKFESGDIAGARAIHNKLFRISKNMFIESNPVPAKYAMSLMGMINEDVRLPLVGLADGSREIIKKLLKDIGAV